MGLKTFGSDPEFMLTKNGNLVSAIDVIKGSSEHRITIKGNEFYYDNVLAECAIKPSTKITDTVKNFKTCLKDFAKLVKGHKLELRASDNYPKSALDNDIARKAGCSKEYCAYLMCEKIPPSDAMKVGTLRTCGGHVHIGADILKGKTPSTYLAVYLLDLFLGVPSLWLDKDPTSIRRRTMYGEAGSFRSKEYGLEYRALSNFWLESPEMVKLVYNISSMVVDYIESGEGWKDWSFDINKFMNTEDGEASWVCHSYDASLLRKGIKSSNKNMVKSHFNLVKSKMPKKLWDELQEQICRSSPQDFYENWSM